MESKSSGNNFWESLTAQKSLFLAQRLCGASRFTSYLVCTIDLPAVAKKAKENAPCPSCMKYQSTILTSQCKAETHQTFAEYHIVETAAHSSLFVARNRW